MDLTKRRPCEVIFHAGYKGRETPRAIRVDGREIPVERVLDLRRHLDAASGEIIEEFRCRLEGGTVDVFVSGGFCWLEKK